jgi:hypothetical protein
MKTYQRGQRHLSNGDSRRYTVPIALAWSSVRSSFAGHAANRIKVGRKENPRIHGATVISIGDVVSAWFAYIALILEAHSCGAPQARLGHIPVGQQKFEFDESVVSQNAPSGQHDRAPQVPVPCGQISSTSAHPWTMLSRLSRSRSEPTRNTSAAAE